MPASKDLPSTLRRSPEKAQDTYIKMHDDAVKEYGEGEHAHRVAFAALKHSFEKVGDRWVAKTRKGPSDARAWHKGKPAIKGRGKSFGGVDYYGHTKDELMERARKLGVRRRSRMDKKELASAIARKQRSR